MLRASSGAVVLSNPSGLMAQHQNRYVRGREVTAARDSYWSPKEITAYARSAKRDDPSEVVPVFPTSFQCALVDALIKAGMRWRLVEEAEMDALREARLEALREANRIAKREFQRESLLDLLREGQPESFQSKLKLKVFMELLREGKLARFSLDILGPVFVELLQEAELA